MATTPTATTSAPAPTTVSGPAASPPTGVMVSTATAPAAAVAAASGGAAAPAPGSGGQPQAQAQPQPQAQTARERAAEERIALDEWDVDAWHALLGEAGLKTYAGAGALYERLCAAFPTYARLWVERAAHCVRAGGDASAVYEAAVAAAPTSVELWRAYLSHQVARAQPGSTNRVLAVFERAVDCAGLDLHATPLWNDYLEFLRSRAVLADSQRRDALRRVYQRAVRTPMLQLEQVWRDYTAFEQKCNSNKEIGRVLLAEMQPKNVDARTECRARKARREGLALGGVPVPPRGRAKDASQAAQWRRYIAAEVANPASLAGPDLHSRVVHAYESALVPLYRYPDVWLEFVTYLYDYHLPIVEVQVAGTPQPKAHRDRSKVDEAVKALEPVFDRAARAVPKCVAVHAHISALWERLGKAPRAVQTLDAHAKAAPTPLAYVHLMRTVRRVEGRDAARRVFARARKDPAAAHPAVYVAAATLEFSVNKDSKVARNVFEFGLKKLPGNAVMARAFADWLWGSGEFEYLKVVLEKTVPTVSFHDDPEAVRALWELWLRVETATGDCASVDRIETMWAEAEQGAAPGTAKLNTVAGVLRRYNYLGFQAMSEAEIAVVDAVKPGGGNDGKRDPRMRRSARGGGGGGGGASAGGGGAAHGDKGGALAANGKVSLQKVVERLNRMAAALVTAFRSQPPTPEMLIKLVLQTPDSFAATPAGGGVLPQAPKRPAPPPNDVFRARQAAKQARTR